MSGFRGTLPTRYSHPHWDDASGPCGHNRRAASSGCEHARRGARALTGRTLAEWHISPVVADCIRSCTRWQSRTVTTVGSRLAQARPSGESSELAPAEVRQLGPAPMGVSPGPRLVGPPPIGFVDACPLDRQTSPFRTRTPAPRLSTPHMPVRRTPFSFRPPLPFPSATRPPASFLHAVCFSRSQPTRHPPPPTSTMVSLPTLPALPPALPSRPYRRRIHRTQKPKVRRRRRPI